ncbi:VOC family protein [Streptomyces polyrhachis]|uniref:VOC family protein n=1 Tax=Streptomyces polyrhachis TaxID=1282885 RepID=A0ABW2GB51_9ACTN
MQKIKTFLWFDGKAEEAAEFYVSLLPDSKITHIERYPDLGPDAPGTPGQVMTVDFELAGQAYTALNGGPEFSFTPAISLMVDCDSQEEVDRLWTALTADGGEDGPCGWLTDRFGLSWQLIPAEFNELMSGGDQAGKDRAFRAMLGMHKLDLGALKAAYEGR